MAQQIQLRRDTAANWTAANPTLAQGEMGVEIDTDKFKFGDGTTAWTSLDYVATGGGGGGAVDSVNGATGVVVLDADDIDDTSTTNKFATSSELSKLAGIEAGADVTDATNVAASGALMAPAGTPTVGQVPVVTDDSPITLGWGAGGGGGPDTVTVAASGATETLTFGRIYDVTMDQSCTFSFTGATSGDAASLTVIVRGAFTPTWPAGVIWGGGSAPAYGSPSVYEFLSVDGGTITFGFLAGALFS